MELEKREEGFYFDNEGQPIIQSKKGRKKKRRRHHKRIEKGVIPDDYTNHFLSHFGFTEFEPSDRSHGFNRSTEVSFSVSSYLSNNRKNEE